jgi:small-conductance mechanosensitive channel
MEIYQQKILETLIVVALYIVAKRIFFKIIDKTLDNRLLNESRGNVIKRVINILLTLIGLICVSLIWGVDQAELAVFIGSALTIVGVAFFAQWSLLSNITSSIILFFNHPVRLNDKIAILEGKEYVIEGEVINIGIFFITLETPAGEEIALPNNIFIQKSIKRIKDFSIPAETTKVEPETEATTETV